MSNIITNPIPAKNVVDLNITWDCLDVPTCVNLESSLQTIIAEICSLKQPLLQDSCVTGINLPDILNSINTRLCSLETPTQTTDANAFDINLCVSDMWTVESNCCIDLGVCGVDDKSKDDQIQSLYSRIVAMCDVIKTQDATIKSLQDQLNTLQLEVSNLNTNCC